MRDAHGTLSDLSSLTIWVPTAASRVRRLHFKA
jgi:hypothetical protein